MKIGIFDSGLGGLLITKRLLKDLPEYDYIYLGDTKRVPYGNRSAETIFEFLKEALDFLYKKDCAMVLVACNTASAEGINRIQKEYLPKYWPDRKIIGILVPTVEKVAEYNEVKKVGVLATQGTVNSNKYAEEMRRLRKDIKVYQSPAPLLVPFIENNEIKLVEPILKKYLSPLLKKKVDGIILGCTHYPALKKMVRGIIGKKIIIFSQDELIAKRLMVYLSDKKYLADRLGRKGRREFFVTDLTKGFKEIARKWFGSGIKLKLVNI